MADIDREQGAPIPTTMVTKYRDMGDGTHALQVYAAQPEGEALDTDLLRLFATQTVTIAAGENASGTIDMRAYTMMIIQMPGLWTAADIGFQVSPNGTSGFQPLYDDLGNIVMVDGPAVNRSYQAPPELAGCGYVRLWSQNGAGVNVNQAGARSITITLKS